MRSSSTLRTLLKCASPSSRLGLALTTVLSLSARLGVLGTALSIGRGEARWTFMAGAVTTLCFMGQRVVQTLVRARFERDLHRSTVEVLLATDVLDVGRAPTQRVVLEGSYHGVPLVVSSLPALVADGVVALFVVPVIVASFPERVLVAVGSALVAVALGVIVARRVAYRGESALSSAYDEVAESLLAAVEGRLELVARGKEQGFSERFAASTARYVRCSDRVGFASLWIGRAPLALGCVVVAAIALVDAQSRAEMTTALWTRAVVLAACLPPLLGAAIGVQSVARATRLVRALGELLERRRRADADKEGGHLTTLPAPFEMEGVYFRYEDDLPYVLSGVSFTWTAAEPLVVVGGNGFGKSTLLKLMLGLRPPSRGSIRVAGMNLSELDMRALRRQIAYLPQKPYLGELHGTLRAAIQMAVSNVTDRQIEEALTRVGLDLDELSDGGDPLSTTLGTLSVGQRQRLAIARVLLEDAPVMLLDEPEANLDRDGRRLVASLVEELVARGRMIAIAAHTSEFEHLSAHPIHLEKRRLERAS